MVFVRHRVRVRLLMGGLLAAAAADALVEELHSVLEFCCCL